MSDRTLKVLSYNIHKGFGPSRRKFILNHIRSAIRTVHADLVFLQEVLGKHDRHNRRIQDWPATSQFEFLAEEIWPHFAYGKNAVYSEGHHGNAILSKFPFQCSENIDITRSRYAKRGLLHGVIKVPSIRKPLHTICLHLDLTKSKRLEQAEILTDRIRDHVPSDCPLLIAGDFNDWQQRMTESLEKTLNLSEVFLETTGAHARTFPARLPTLKLDRIYFRGLKVTKAKCLSKNPWNKLSDHLAVYAELERPSRKKLG